MTPADFEKPALLGGPKAVTLDATDSAGSGLTYAWEQLSGTTVTLSASATAQPVFIAPEVTSHRVSPVA